MQGADWFTVRVHSGQQPLKKKKKKMSSHFIRSTYAPAVLLIYLALEDTHVQLLESQGSPDWLAILFDLAVLPETFLDLPFPFRNIPKRS